MIQQSTKNSADEVETTSKPRNEHVTQIRFTPNAKLLDVRGHVAERIARDLKLSKWRVTNTTVEVFNENRSTLCLVGFKDAAFVDSDIQSGEFITRARRFFDVLFSMREFERKAKIVRAGSRTRFCTPFNGEFEELRTMILERYLCFSSEARNSLGLNDKTTVADFAFNVYFRLGDVQSNTVVGPMVESEFQQQFTADTGFPATGLYVDVDSFRTPKTVLEFGDSADLIRELTQISWERGDQLRRVILGE